MLFLALQKEKVGAVVDVFVDIWSIGLVFRDKTRNGIHFQDPMPRMNMAYLIH